MNSVVAERKPKAARPVAKKQLKSKPLKLPRNVPHYEVEMDKRTVALTNLTKQFWPELEITKGDLIQFYIDISPYLLPHLKNRAMVLKRYPNGAYGKFFFQKRAPTPRPDWIEICNIESASEDIIDFPIIRDLPSLLWAINLGCIDLNPWYARCGDVHRPDYLHFDLDPVEGAEFDQLCEAALLVHRALDALKIPNFVKTTGSRGFHVYVPIEIGPTQKEVWTFAKEFAESLETLYPALITAEYRVAKRPKGRILVDYNQNAWGRTLASVYSVRPKPHAPVSTPISWKELESGIRIEDFRLDNVLQRVRKIGDLWEPLLQSKNRFKLETMLKRRIK